MAIHARTPSLNLATSTTSATGAIPASSAKYIRVVNGSTTSVMYVNVGATGVVATNANVGIEPFGALILERDTNTDVAVACLLASGTGTASIYPTLQDS